jgi:hypothetical protein
MTGRGTPLVLSTRCKHDVSVFERCDDCGTEVSRPRFDVSRVERPCPGCGRPFKESSWEKGYPYLQHNRVKGVPDKGWCRGAGPLPRSASASSPIKVDDGNGNTSLAPRREASAGPTRSRGVPLTTSAERVGILHRWRNQLARDSGMRDPEEILTASMLRQIAYANPGSIDSLSALTDLTPEWIGAHGNSVLFALSRRP